MSRLRTGPGLLLAAAAYGCGAGMGTAAPPAPPLSPSDQVAALLAEPPFDRVHWGVLAVDAGSGDVLIERNADLLFIPASNQKLLVTAAALGLLGPDHRWETTFYSRTRPVDGVIPGDLYLPGEGDPTLGAPFFDPPERALAALADSLGSAGVRRVDGRLVLDASAWDSTSVPESWMMEDLDGAYGATGGAFSVRTGELAVEIRGGDRVGEPAEVEWAPRGIPEDPDAVGGFVVHDITTVEPSGADPPELRLEFRPESRHWLLSGGIAVGESRTLTRSSRDPVRLAVSALHRALEDRGIDVAGGTAILWEEGLPVETRCASGRIPGCAEMLRIAGLASPPLAEVVGATLGPSQNWMAEQLVRTLGAELGEAGSWAEGFGLVLGWLVSEVGADAGSFHFEDGSGLSAQNLVSPRALVRALDHARARPWGVTYRNALARPGAENTTLESRLGALEGRLWAKTGTISHVNSLSGYLTTEDGREIVFAILSNGANLPAGVVRDRIDAVVEVLGSGGAAP